MEIFNWIQHLDLSYIDYVGGDIVDSMVDTSNKASRGCLVHLKPDHGIRAINNISRSGARYLLITTFTDLSGNTGEFRSWRTLNMEKEPFSLGTCEQYLANIKTAQGFSDKSLGL